LAGRRKTEVKLSIPKKTKDGFGWFSFSFGTHCVGSLLTGDVERNPPILLRRTPFHPHEIVFCHSLIFESVS
jgi:hypothetical protein